MFPLLYIYIYLPDLHYYCCHAQGFGRHSRRHRIIIIITRSRTWTTKVKMISILEILFSKKEIVRAFVKNNVLGNVKWTRRKRKRKNDDAVRLHTHWHLWPRWMRLRSGALSIAAAGTHTARARHQSPPPPPFTRRTQHCGRRSASLTSDRQRRPTNTPSRHPPPTKGRPGTVTTILHPRAPTGLLARNNIIKERAHKCT